MVFHHSNSNPKTGIVRKRKRKVCGALALWLSGFRTQCRGQSPTRTHTHCSFLLPPCPVNPRQQTHLHPSAQLHPGLAAFDFPSPAALTCQPEKQASQASTDEAHRRHSPDAQPAGRQLSQCSLAAHIHSLSSEARAFLPVWSQVASPSSWQERRVTADLRAQASSVAHSRCFSGAVTPADVSSLPPQCP